MALDHYREIARIAESRLRDEIVHAFNNSMAGRENTGRMEIAFVGELARAETTQSKRKKSAQRFLRDIQQIMRDGEMASYVARAVFDDKSDAQIAEIVAGIETKTGMTLEEYAVGIIDGDAVRRMPGESETDYNRRIVMAVAEKITDPRTGKIKPEYAGDPLAQIIIADEAYKAFMIDVARVNRGGADADALVTEFANAGYTQAKHAAQHAESKDHQNALRDGQNDHADKTNNTDEIAAEASNFFGSDVDEPVKAPQSGWSPGK